MNNALAKAEQAGKNAFLNGSISEYTTAEQIARSAYASVIEREWFVAGWNSAFWDEQERVLKAIRSEVEG